MVAVSNDGSRGTSLVVVVLNANHRHLGLRLSELGRTRNETTAIAVTALGESGVRSLVQVILEFVAVLLRSKGRNALLRSDETGVHAVDAPGLEDAVLKLGGAERAGGGSLLLEDLLLLRVGVTNLDGVFLSIGNLNGGVIELANDLLADVARLETSEANTATMAGGVTEDLARADLVGCEDVLELRLVDVAGNVRDVEVGVGLIGELLELGVEGFLNEVSRDSTCKGDERRYLRVQS